MHCANHHSMDVRYCRESAHVDPLVQLQLLKSPGTVIEVSFDVSGICSFTTVRHAFYRTKNCRRPAQPKENHIPLLSYISFLRTQTVSIRNLIST
jgi:hypothetical protein